MSLSIRNLCYHAGDKVILDNISFEAEKGEILAVLGQNGAGKSTLFRCITGAVGFTSGEILYDGKCLNKMTAALLSECISYIPQILSDYSDMSVIDIVLMGAAGRHPFYYFPDKKERERAEEILKRLDIISLSGREYRSLSGGERALCVIARALMQEAKLIIMDEPSANLDFGNREKLMFILRELSKEGIGIIYSTHDPDMAYRYSDRILALEKGSVLAHGKPEEVITGEVVSALYKLPVEVIKLKEDEVRVCLPG